MRSETFTVVFPPSNLQPTFVDVSTIGTALNGVATGVPTLVTPVDDITISGGSQSGDGIVTARVSATDTVRLGAKGLGSNPITVLVTVFD